MTSSSPPERILLVANRTCPCHELHEILERRGGPGARVVIVAPALNGRLAHAVSDTDGAVADARARLATAVEHLRDAGIEAEGIVGDSNPLVAIENARSDFGIPMHHVIPEYGLETPAASAA